MIKGISRQVIVVHSPDKKMFEQAIFILSNDAVGPGVTDEMLLREARNAIGRPQLSEKWRLFVGPLWACGGAGAMGLIWLLCALL